MDLRANTAVDVLIGPFMDSTDGNSVEDGLTIAQADVRLSKNGQTLAQKNDITTCVNDPGVCFQCFCRTRSKVFNCKAPGGT